MDTNRRNQLLAKFSNWTTEELEQVAMDAQSDMEFFREKFIIVNELIEEKIREKIIIVNELIEEKINEEQNGSIRWKEITE